MEVNKSRNINFSFYSKTFINMSRNIKQYILLPKRVKTYGRQVEFYVIMGGKRSINSGFSLEEQS